MDCTHAAPVPELIRSSDRYLDVPGTSAGAGHTAAERQVETAKAKAQATSGPEVAASPASPDSSYCASGSQLPTHQLWATTHLFSVFLDL